MKPRYTHTPYGYAKRTLSHLSTDNDKLLARVRRLRGQVEAIERAIETGNDCAAILQFVASVRGAMGGALPNCWNIICTTTSPVPATLPTERAGQTR